LFDIRTTFMVKAIFYHLGGAFSLDYWFLVYILTKIAKYAIV